VERRREVLNRQGRRMRSRAAVVGLALAVAAGIPVVAGSASASPFQGGVAASPAAEVAQNRFDGATLLKGLFFGMGPAAARYPDLVRARVNTTAGHVAAVDRLVADAEAREPGFLNRFATGMYSGNHVDIQSVTREAGRLLVSGAEAAEGMPSNSQYDVVIDIDFVWTSVVAYDIVVVVIHVFTITPTGSMTDVASGVAGEQWVDSVALTL
jgi:SdpC family antimicrobial peptide